MNLEKESGDSYFLTLCLEKVTVEDAGKYKVTAKNELGESNATISLNFDSMYNQIFSWYLQSNSDNQYVGTSLDKSLVYFVFFVSCGVLYGSFRTRQTTIIYHPTSTCCVSVNRKSSSSTLYLTFNNHFFFLILA